MVTINDISKMTGFSKSTISKAINNYKDVKEETKQIILDAVVKLGYIPNASAKSLATKKTWTIGVVFEELTGVGITHPFFSEVLNEFKKYMENYGYDLLFISNSLGNKLSYYEHCIQKGVDGIIILCTDIESEHIKKLLSCNIPSVLIDSHSNLTNCVYSDSYTSIYQATKYLIDKGHTKIGHLAGAIKTFIGSNRLRGYIDALKSNNIKIRKDFIFNGSDYTMEQGYKRGLEISNMLDKPTAIITASDNLAIGLLNAFEEKKIKVPNDISIIGFDNNELSKYISPPLTTIEQNKKQIAIEAAKLLLRQIDNSKLKYKKKIIKTTLIERQTVKDIG